ncbi:nucleotide sugar dehydrogenase [Patescibacteria group bacterium]|nr:nucleotide sugar dehydrogenase [Patescibacteria group bacterium]
MKKLTKLIKNKTAKIGIIGLGYVGLPLAIALATKKFKVFGIEPDKNKVKAINNHNSYIKDIKSSELQAVVKNKKLIASTNKSILAKVDVIIICVPTPLDEHKQPDISALKEATKSIKKYIKKGQLIILESTTYPGTTREVLLPILAKSKLKVGKDFWLVFSPERIDPGNKKYNVTNIPKVIGGITANGSQLASLLYKSFIPKTIIVSSPDTAEMTKLLENIFRIVNISMINELALVCGKMNIDIWEVIKAASTKPYGFMPFYPGPGVGGHCIPLDPFYLSWKAKEYNFYTRFIELAGEINQQMPHYIVTKIITALNKNQQAINNSKILIWGVAYKKDIADTRESSAYPIMTDLIKKRAKIDYFDPHVKEIKIGQQAFKSIKYTPEVLKNYDCVVILAKHSGFNYDVLAKQSALVVDTRNAIKSRQYKNVFYL